MVRAREQRRSRLKLYAEYHSGFRMGYGNGYVTIESCDRVVVNVERSKCKKGDVESILDIYD